MGAEAIDALRKLREENLRLREENVEFREVSAASQCLAEEAVSLARSLSPVRNRPAQDLSGAKSPNALRNPRLIGRLVSSPNPVASSTAGSKPGGTPRAKSEAESFQPIGAVGPEVQRCCAALAQSKSQGMLASATSFSRLNAPSRAH